MTWEDVYSTQRDIACDVGIYITSSDEEAKDALYDAVLERRDDDLELTPEQLDLLNEYEEG
jgi:hypothetical protein